MCLQVGGYIYCISPLSLTLPAPLECLTVASLSPHLLYARSAVEEWLKSQPTAKRNQFRDHYGLNPPWYQDYRWWHVNDMNVVGEALRHI